MDLHAWITQQVSAVERAAAAARDDIASLLAWHGAGSLIAERHIKVNRPEAVLRRCEADRRILARHEPQPNGTGFEDGWQCRTCSVDGGDGYQYLAPYPCPTVEDLAHAHGITPEVLAGLDQPQQPEPRIHNARSLADVLGIATPPITTSDVPEALRGPRWKP
jgi:hypothetical protein